MKMLRHYIQSDLLDIIICDQTLFILGGQLLVDTDYGLLYLQVWLSLSHLVKVQ